MKTNDKTMIRLMLSINNVIRKAARKIYNLMRNIILDDESPLLSRDHVKFWRNQVFYLALFVVMLFGTPLIIYGSYEFYKAGEPVNAAIELIIFFITIFVSISRKLSITYKKYYITYGLYIYSIFLLITAGLKGGGMVRVVFSLILAGILLEKSQIAHFIAIDFSVFTILTVLLYTGVFDGTKMEAFKEVWFVDGYTAQAFGIMLLVMMNAIYAGLEKQTRYIRKSEVSLAASETRHKAMIANISDAIVIIDADGTVTYHSPNLHQRFPWMPQDILQSSFYDNFDPRERNRIEETVKSLLGAEGSKKTIEARYQTDGNEAGYLELTAVNLTKDSYINGILINYSDITERKLWEKEIIYLNQHDSLTGLYNRNYFEMKKIQLDTQEQLPLSIIVGDINGLKIINDSLGHSEGDKLLSVIADIIKKCIRKEDIAARISGDEYNILLPKTSLEEALEIIKAIHSECGNYNKNINGDLYHLSISLGASTKTVMEETLNQIQKSAEDYMYKRKLLEGRSFHSSIISSMQTALFEKSFETELHAHRLIFLSKEIGKAVGLSDQQFDELELFAALHDIGKIGIDNQILNKPSSLTEEEWVKMRKHSEIGYRIAMASPELVSIAYYILTHHERWDGKGYPQGLSGENIPLLSRILALADSYDAMTNDRPYRKGMSKQAAINEIERNTGTQFDPELAKIFIRILSDHEMV